MTQEAYCSFGISKLLKEKGFGWGTQYVYTEDGKGIIPPKMGKWKAKSNIPMVTHQMACAWLRDVHKVLIVIDAYHADHWEGYIDSYKISIYSHASTIIVPDDIAHQTDYEDAMEAAIKYCLENLI